MAERDDLGTDLLPLTSEAILRGFDDGLGGVTVLWVPPAEAGGR